MTRAELRTIVAGVLEVEAGALTSDTDLKAIETFDSVAVLTLVIELDEKAGIKLDPAGAQSLRYFRDIEELARRQGVSLTD